MPPSLIAAAGSFRRSAVRNSRRIPQEIETEAPSEVDRVDVLAWYDGFDENGDGVFADWHHYYHYADIAGHAGTAGEAPFRVSWDTRWVPDQEPGTVKLLARRRASRSAC